LNQWQLKKAEKALRYLVAKTRSSESIKLYFATLLKEGELKKALRVWRGLKSKKITSDVEILTLAAKLYFYLGKQDSSESIARKLIKLSYNKYQPYWVSESFNILGLNEFTKANYRKAYFYQKKALSFARKTKAPKQIADAFRQIGVLRWYWGELDSALVYYRRALAYYRQVNDKIGVATTLSNIGLLYFNWNDWLNEFKYNLQALFIRQRIGDKIGLADSYNFLSHIPPFNKSVEAFRLKFIKKSYTLSKTIGYWWGEQVSKGKLFNEYSDFEFGDSSFIYDRNFGEGAIFSLFLRVRKALKKKDFIAAENLLRKTLHLADSLNYETVKFNSIVSLAQILIKKGELKESYRLINKALKITENSSKVKYNRGVAREILAELLLKSNKRFKALKILNKLVAYYDSLYYYTINRKPSIWGYQVGVQNISRGRSHVFKILLDAYYLTDEKGKFFETLERERELPLWNSSRMEDVNSQSVNKFLKLLESFIEGRLTDLSTQNKLLAMLGNLLIEERKNEKKVSNITGILSSTLKVKLDDFRNKLPPDVTFIEFGFGTASVYALLINKNNSRLIKINLNEEDLKDLVTFYLNTLLRGKENPADKIWEISSDKIFNLILKPILNSGIPGNKNILVISPIGSLSLLPFASLINNLNGKINYLIESHPVIYAQSASEYLRNKLLNNFRINSFAAFVPNQKRLKNSLKEVQYATKNLFGTSNVFINANATQSNFINKLMSYDVIHFAGHTIIDVNNPFESALNFYDKSLKLSDLFRYKTSAQLMVLSSCNSGLVSGIARDIPSSDDYISFPRVLLASGIKGVVAMFWEANDFTTSLLLNNFYTLLKLKRPFRLVNFAVALASSQREFIENNSLIAYRHPFYWSGVYLKF